MNKVKYFDAFINEGEGVPNFMQLGARGEQVKVLQTSLENLGFRLKKFGVDGKFGPETFQALKMTLDTISKLTNVVSIVGDPALLNYAPDAITQTQYNVAVMVGQKPEMAEQIKAKMVQTRPTQNSTTPMAIQQLINKNIPDADTFMSKLKQICQNLGIQESWLLVVMYKECRLDPKAIAKSTGASGLIQFMPSTATGLGTSVEAIRQMSATDQLDYVEKYLKRWSGKMNSVTDVYMSVFYPVAVNKDDSFIIGSEKSPGRVAEIAKGNPAISAGKNQIAKSDFKSYIMKGVPVELAQAV